jgi:hypothetical protein
MDVNLWMTDDVNRLLGPEKVGAGVKKNFRTLLALPAYTEAEIASDSVGKHCFTCDTEAGGLNFLHLVDPQMGEGIFACFEKGQVAREEVRDGMHRTRIK